ncbi:hypothetical protein B0J17DRAFT_657877 [Rhizoctonia solani]|nr:hypothetical protein B0J17DRAFT_657877 [Rhizoctonia solani]
MPFTYRIRDVFPPGVGSVSANRRLPGRSHYTLAPDQLYRTLTSYEPGKHVESIVVKSAWYGKQSRLARQEFIVIQVEDTAIKGLTNYIALDRSTSTPSSVFSGLLPHSRLRFHGEMARDAFKVAYDGVEEHLLHECNLDPHKRLEQLEFHADEPLLLYQLSTLVYLISEQYPEYGIADINGSWFARLIWECMRKMRPRATVTHYDQAVRKRGKLGWVCAMPDSTDVTEICQAFDQRTETLELELSERKKRWAELSRCESLLQDVL